MTVGMPPGLLLHVSKIECLPDTRGPLWDFPIAQMVKNLPVMQKTQVQSLGQEDPWRREWQPAPVFLPGESHGQRSLVGYRPGSCKESDVIEQLSTRFLLNTILGPQCLQ